MGHRKRWSAPNRLSKLDFMKRSSAMRRLSDVLVPLCILGLFAACTSSGATSAMDASPGGNKDARVSDDVLADVNADLPASGPDSRATDDVASKPDVVGQDAVDERSVTPDAASDPTPAGDKSAPSDSAGKADAVSPDLPSADEKLATADIAAAKPEAADLLSRDLLAGTDAAACTQTPFTHLTPLELKTLLDGGEDPFLINVKGDSIKNIPGTDAVLANDVPGIEALVKQDLCANIVLYCRSGGTSQSVGSQLVTKGYKRVRDLAGGIQAWEAAGYPTE
jgi:phage shock protein E